MDAYHEGTEGVDESMASAAAPETQVQVFPVQPLLKNRRYLFLMSAQAVSNLGDWLYILALFVLVGFRWHGSPMVISLMMLSLTGPMVILGPFTGMLADKWNRTTLMMISNLVMACLVGLIPLLPARWMLFVILLLVGVFESLFSPAESGKLKEIVPDEQMQQAASINSSIMQLAKIVGPGISGFLVAAFGSMSAFWLDSISFILSTILLIFTGFRAVLWRVVANEFEHTQPPIVHTEGPVGTKQTVDAEQIPDVEQIVGTEQTIAAHIPKNDGATPKQQTARQRFMEGFNHIRSIRILWVGTLILTLALFFVQLTDAQIVTLLRLIPNASSSLVGIMMGLSGAGGLIAALLTGLIKWKSTSRIMSLGSAGIGLALGISALVVQNSRFIGALNFYWMALIAVLAMMVGACAGLVFIPFQSTAQQNTPSHLTGRVFGTVGSLTTGASLLGPAVGGILVTAIGVVAAYLVTASALILIGAMGLLFGRWLEGSSVVETGQEVHSSAL